jgi:pilus assembly protein CpaB
MVNNYIQQKEQQIKEQAKKAILQMQQNQVAVLVAKTDIPKGVTIEPEMLETAIIPNQYLVPQAVTSLDRISGMVTIAPISKGEQISLSKLTQRRQVSTGGGLAQVTPAGKRAITIPVDNISSLAGMIRPGDYVDVIAVLPVPIQTPDGKQTTQMAVIPLFQNVLVLAVGQELSGISKEQEETGRYKKEEKREPSPLITLALSPQEAHLLAFVQEQGKIRLTLRSPIDSQIQPVQPASWETLFQYVMPSVPSTPEVKPEAKSETEKKPQVPQEYVEIYRGLNKEKVPLTR